MRATAAGTIFALLVSALNMPCFGLLSQPEKNKAGPTPCFEIFPVYTGLLQIIVFVEWLAIDRAAGSSSLRPGPHPRPRTAVSR
jgi:hypothetical protein